MRKISKKLTYKSGNVLVIDKDEIYKIDGNPIEVKPLEMTLYYMQDGKATKISTFKPVFPDLEGIER